MDLPIPDEILVINERIKSLEILTVDLSKQVQILAEALYDALRSITSIVQDVCQKNGKTHED